MNGHERIIVALDTPRIDEANALMHELKNVVGMFKVGLELICSEGLPRVVEGLAAPLMVDLKLADIPNTMKGAVRALGNIDGGSGRIRFITVHASVGEASIAAAVEEADKFGAKILAVTVLTSIGEAQCAEIFHLDTRSQALALTDIAFEAGAYGVVCSPREVARLREDYAPDGLAIVTPGVRPPWAQTNDQARVASPGKAIAHGADFVVVGRPITQPPEHLTPLAAANAIAEMIEDGLKVR